MTFVPVDMAVVDSGGESYHAAWGWIMRLGVSAGLLVMVAVLAVGCGSSSTSTSGPHPSASSTPVTVLTVAQYRDDVRTDRAALQASVEGVANLDYTGSASQKATLAKASARVAQLYARWKDQPAPTALWEAFQRHWAAALKAYSAAMGPLVKAVETNDQGKMDEALPYIKTAAHELTLALEAEPQ